MEQLKLKPEAKEKWLKALRSGEYEQCHDRLSDGEGYCCLGVAAKVINGLDDRTIQCAGSLPEAKWVHEWFVPIPTLSWEDNWARNPRAKGLALSSMNDAGMTFAEIADVIEEHF